MPQVFLDWEEISETILEKVFFLFRTVSSYLGLYVQKMALL
jgi:hypothetical protein